MVAEIVTRMTALVRLAWNFRHLDVVLGVALAGLCAATAYAAVIVAVLLLQAADGHPGVEWRAQAGAHDLFLNALV